MNAVDELMPSVDEQEVNCFLDNSFERGEGCRER